MKNKFLSIIVSFIISVAPCSAHTSKISSLQKGKIQKRWTQLINIHAQYELDTTKQEQLYTLATTLAQQSEKSLTQAKKNNHPTASRELRHIQKLSGTIDKQQQAAKKHAQKKYYSDARMALRNKMVAHKIVKQADLLTMQLAKKKDLMALYEYKKKKKKYNELAQEVNHLAQKRLIVLESAQLTYFAAAQAYIQAYDSSQKIRFLNKAQDLIAYNVHAIEVAKYESSFIYIINDTIAQLSQQIDERKKLVKN